MRESIQSLCQIVDEPDVQRLSDRRKEVLQQLLLNIVIVATIVIIVLIAML